jgi:hypothetical protein
VLGVVGFFIPAIVNIEENANGATLAERELVQADALAGPPAD